MFACLRDCGANVLQLEFREGTPSVSRQRANHAFTEWPTISSPVREAQGVSTGEWSPPPEPPPHDTP